jgi:broad specificity phosphatase PhoE
MLRSTSALVLTRLATTTSTAMAAAVDASSCAGGTRLRLGLVRHGESMNNVHTANGTYKTGRVADPELSARGRRQAEVLGAFLGNASKAGFLGLRELDEIWVSPHKRTLDTAAPTVQALGLAPRVVTDIFEAGGIYDASDSYDAFVAQGGMTRAEMAAAHPTYVLPADVTDEGWYRLPGRESDDECRARAKRVLEHVRTTAAELEASRNVLVVAHYDFISAFLDAILVPETSGEFVRWRHHNSAVTVLDIETTGDVALVKVNAAPHIYEADEGLLSGFPL